MRKEWEKWKSGRSKIEDCTIEGFLFLSGTAAPHRRRAVKRTCWMVCFAASRDRCVAWLSCAVSALPQEDRNTVTEEIMGLCRCGNVNMGLLVLAAPREEGISSMRMVMLEMGRCCTALPQSTLQMGVHVHTSMSNYQTWRFSMACTEVECLNSQP